MFGIGQGQFFSSLLGLPWFALYFLVAAGVMAIFALIYTRITPHDEFALIRAGNLAASVGFAGALVGFSIPLAKAISQAVSIPDMLVWALAALLVQLLVYRCVRFIIPDLAAKIAAGELSAGVTLGAAALASGMINAASMSL
jgi:putative membrane protein